MSRRKTNPPRRSHTQRPKHARAQPETQRHESPGSFEAEVLRGIAPFAEQELGRLGGMQSMQSDGRE
ncbi:MAG TPA: hypothetical protein VF171_07555, partial [Trueperaceae bacterium]